MEVGEARSECHSGAPPREPKAREARFGQVFARRTLRLTGKSATADFRLGNPRQKRAALERNEALVWERKTGRFFKSLVPGAVGQRSTYQGGNTPSPTPPTSAATADFRQKIQDIPRRELSVSGQHTKAATRPVHRSLPPQKKTPHGPPTSSQSGYQRALQRRGVGGRGGPSDSLFLALPGALRARLAFRRGWVCVPAAFRPPCRGAPFPAASLFKTWFYFSASAGSCRRSPCSTASWPAPAPARRSP